MSSILPTYARLPLSFESGSGALITADSGETYLDFGAGIAVNLLGHAHPHLVEALTEQAGKLWHTSNLFQIPGQERLARRLTEATFADTVFFTNSGSEAIECAIKMTRKFHSHNGAPERYAMITFDGAFHGRTLAAIAAGGNAKYLDGFGPVVEGFDQVAFGDLEATRKAIGAHTAGILIEPVQGEGGIRPAAPGFLKGLRKLCDEHGLLLVFDEVQCGMGRTGKLFAHEWAGIAPDIMAVAKGIGGGFPLGACLATTAAAAGMKVGSHGSTYGGNPLAMAVGNAVLDVVLKDGFLEAVRRASRRLSQKLAALPDQFGDIVEEVRGEGLMLGLKCRIENTRLLQALLDQRLLSIGAGDNVVRLLPPLIVSDDQIDDAVARIETACKALRDSAQEGA